MPDSHITVEAVEESDVMADRVFLRLSEGWALGFDKNQWIVLKRTKRRDEHYWHPVSFIGSTKTNLLRVVAEKGVTVDPEAQRAIDAMPDRFLDWLEEHSRPGPEVEPARRAAE